MNFKTIIQCKPFWTKEIKLYRAESSAGEKIKFHAWNDSDARHWILNHCNCPAEWTFREEK